MAKTVNMCVRIDPELKAKAEEVLDQLGMNMNGTINMFLTQIVREKKVPLNLSLNTEDKISSDIRTAQKDRANGLEGVDARDLLAEMKKIIADAEAKETVLNDKVVI